MPDPWFPRYHLRPRSGWINDPNGLIHYKGRYHAFYQTNPYGAEWGGIHWGHAESPDLVHWVERGIALAPRRDEGEAHCFSGSAAIGPSGSPWLFYTSIGEGPDAIACGAEQWAAVAHGGQGEGGLGADGASDLVRFSRRHRLLGADEGRRLGVRDWRDPFVWRDRDGWAMATGASRGGRGVVALHRSADCIAWSFEGILFEDPRVALIECPCFFPLGELWCLIDSPCGAVRWHTGRWDGSGPFLPEAEGIVDSGGRDSFYAPQVFDGPPSEPGLSARRLMIGWLPESARTPGGAFGKAPMPAPGACDASDAWAGALSLPMELSLASCGRLLVAPARELEAARSWPLFDMGDAGCPSSIGDTGASYELTARVAEAAIIDILASSDGTERTRLVVDQARDRMEIDRSRSTSMPGIDLSAKKAALPPRGDGRGADGASEELRVFVDASIVEAFFRGTRLSARVYPRATGPRRVEVIGGARSQL
jgi:beta-fructofuranosidase